MNPIEPAPTAEEIGGDASQAFRLLARRAIDLFAVIDFPALRFRHLNDEGRALLGIGPEGNLDAINCTEFLAHDLLTSLLYDVGPAALAGRDWCGEAVLRAVGGSECAVKLYVSGLPARDDHGDQLAIAAIDTNATREARQSLMQEQMFLRALLKHVPDSIYFKDLQSRFLRVSDSQVRKKKFRNADELIGKTDFDVFAAEHAQNAFDDEQRIIRTGEPVIDKEEREVWPDGRVTWVSTSKLPLQDPKGRVIGTFGVSRDITARKVAEEKLKTTQKELLAASRLAGMAEIASGVLHNLGNALNSVGTSAAILTEQFGRSRIQNLAKAAQMLEQHSSDLAAFLTADARGRQLPAYFIQLAAALAAEREQMLGELAQLRRNVEHMSEVVAMQQNYARGSSLAEDCQAAELVEESLHISAISLSRHGITVVRDFKPVPNIHVTRHKVLQILVNLIRNAKYAMDETGRADKPMTITIAPHTDGLVRISVRDEGVGIAAENLTKIFGFGFTTRKDGHGFGLHSSANAARELGGHLAGHSEGPGQGAVFTLDLPVAGARIHATPAVA
ncbi:MAG: PAS domain-containing protein [Opitutaceae bacterium]|nr:PAS domain-containing protein [Opitutaceae bacterium]